ncbi:hypothetical protein HYT24_03070 [Candidatus Pacearchaeota archaeon]|nr:hypothetical protein [Candidatus Pacearchaeota archaeon]
MKYKLSRFDLAQIREAHERYILDSGKERRLYATEQLARIDATLPISRFDLAQRIQEIERDMIN